jgi:GntR family transcriptional regulator, glc operon transcriptional activator
VLPQQKVSSEQNIADVVAEQIEKLIVEGVLKPGQILPSERRLTEKLEVSRTAVREGIKIVRARGIVETSHGLGSYVTDSPVT